MDKIEAQNHLYNLATQYTQEMRSLWRIKKFYMDDSQSEEEKILWRSMIEEKTNHITELRELMKKAL